MNQAPKDWRASAFLLERSWPNEYARTERIEQIGEQADDKKISLNVYYNNDQPLPALLDFPIHASMGQGHDSAKAAREKQRRLTGEFDATKKASASKTISDASPPDEEKISDAPPPKVVNPALTGRIRPEWKGNGK